MTGAAAGVARDAGGALGRMASMIDASPTPYHAVGATLATLRAAGFAELERTGDWSGAVDGPCVVVRDGALVAWGAAADGGPAAPLRMIGAHTDSPNLRIRPRPDRGVAGARQLAVEVYGGALLNSWLDRDLGLAGRVAVRDGGGGVRHLPFRTDRPVLRVPQLAIHLDREISSTGLRLDPQQHLAPVWGLGDAHEGDFRTWLAAQVDVAVGDVVAWDAMCFDDEPSRLLGVDGDLLAAPRLDDQCSCWGATEALLAVASDRPAATPLVVLFDHEEVGSSTATGAAGSWLAQVLERRVAALGGTRVDHLRSLAGSALLSADMAHATHPNHPEKHEPNHWIRLGGGPVVKHNVNERYATGSRGAGLFRAAAEAAGVPVQDYSHRGDLPCGSTIGPIAAAGLAVDTVDVGMAQLSMHSARELMATADVEHLLASFTSWFAVPAGAGLA